MISFPFNLVRFAAIIRKEFIQMRRDRLTFAMMFGIPIVQLILFGFAINSDPKDLPVAVLASDNSPFARRFVHALENSGYFKIVDHVETCWPGGTFSSFSICPRTFRAGSSAERDRRCWFRPTRRIRRL